MILYEEPDAILPGKDGGPDIDLALLSPEEVAKLLNARGVLIVHDVVIVVDAETQQMLMVTGGCAHTAYADVAAGEVVLDTLDSPDNGSTH